MCVCVCVCGHCGHTGKIQIKYAIVLCTNIYISTCVRVHMHAHTHTHTQIPIPVRVFVNLWIFLDKCVATVTFHVNSNSTGAGHTTNILLQLTETSN